MNSSPSVGGVQHDANVRLDQANLTPESVLESILQEWYRTHAYQPESLVEAFEGVLD